MKKEIFTAILSVLVFISTAFAVEECFIEKNGIVARDEEVIEQIIQFQRDNDAEGIDALLKQRRIFQIPETVKIKVEEKSASGGEKMKILMFGNPAWTTQGYINCHELVDLTGINYWPLAAGNKWEYRRTDFASGKSDTYEIFITYEIAQGNGSIGYFTGDKPYVYRYDDRIIDADGGTRLKYPVTHSMQWKSGTGQTREMIFWLKDAGFSIDVNGKTYTNCIRLIAKTDYIAMLNQESGSVEYKALEIHEIFAPEVGVIKGEGYEILKGANDKVLKSITELISFKTNQPVADNIRYKPETEKLVGRMDSFRFPHGNFIHPVLSPDEKWLIYYEYDTVWERLYYTRFPGSDQKPVPVFPENIEKQDIRKIIHLGKWSPDGKILAVTAEIDYKDGISLIDFSGDEPKFIEFFKGDEPFVWLGNRSLMCLDEFGNIAIKAPGKPPEPAVFFRSSYKGNDYASQFQVALDKTIMYTDAKGSVYLTHLTAPDKRTPLFHNPRKIKSQAPGLKLSAHYDLSPNGKYAVFYLTNQNKNDQRTCVLINLSTLRVMDEFPVSKNRKALWSPDGLRLAYLGENESVQVDKDDRSKGVMAYSQFYIMNVETSDIKNCGIRVGDEFNWAPDGEHIVYSGSNRDINLTSYRQRITDNMKNQQKPSVKHVGGIFIMNIDGREIGQISTVYAHLKLEMSSSGKYIIWQALNLDNFFIATNPFLSQMK